MATQPRNYSNNTNPRNQGNNKQSAAPKKSGNLPEHKLKAGSIVVTIWRNDSDKGTYRSIGIERNYLDKNNQWQKTQSLRVGDLPKVTMLLNKAFELVTTGELDRGNTGTNHSNNSSNSDDSSNSNIDEEMLEEG